MPKWRTRLLSNTAFLAALLISCVAISPAQRPAKPTLIVLVADGESPAAGARVTVERLGRVTPWPKHNDRIEITADGEGRTELVLPPGKYLVIGSQSRSNKMPAKSLVTIKAGAKVPAMIRLVLSNEDCSKANC